MAIQSTTKGLGKGFDALIPTDFDNSLLSDISERIQQIAVDSIIANPDQPRKHFDETALEELAFSIKRYGVLQPIVVTKQKEGYVLIAGERRWRAAKLNKLKQVPAIVRSHAELEQLEIALIENVQRVDLSPLEQAASIQRLHDQFSLTYETIAKRLGKASTTVNNIVRLLQLPPDAQKALLDNLISEGHARAVLALKDNPSKQRELLEAIKKYGWSVRQAEKFAVTTKLGKKTEKETKDSMATVNTQTKKLGKYLGTPVTIRHTAKGGRLEVHFKSEEDLSRIVKIIGQNHDN